MFYYGGQQTMCLFDKSSYGLHFETRMSQDLKSNW